MNTVLIVDDDATICDLIALGLEEVGLDSRCIGDGRGALAALETQLPLAVILDLVLPDISGLDVLASIRENYPGLPVIVITACEDLETAVECMRQGAHDYLQKPFESTRLATTVRNACQQATLASKLEAVARERKRERGFSNLRGNSPALLQTLKTVRRALSKDVTILIQGESGTGKEVLARAIHAESRRSAGPFIPVNCGAIPESLIESELFGHEKGAFTGADQARPGLFEQAEGGVVFLDEIGELRPDLQVRLLRVLQERRVKRVGANTERAIDTRVIAATNRDLQHEASAGRFREDLYYRLAVFPVTLPPLRERDGDVLILAEHFLALAREHMECPVVGFGRKAKLALNAYAWPGNVRQLQNVIERSVILAEGPVIKAEDLTDEILCNLHESNDLPPATSPRSPMIIPLEIRPLAEVEHDTILHALEFTNWNVSETAERLGIGRATLYRRLNQYGIQRTSLGSDPEVELKEFGS
ncbi:MAG: two-component system response regulator AtoC [Planctomycetota bacterium]